MASPRKNRRHRIPRPFYRTARGAWFVQLHGCQVRLDAGWGYLEGIAVIGPWAQELSRV